MRKQIIETFVFFTLPSLAIGLAILALLFVLCEAEAATDEGIPLWRMPAGSRRVVVCEGERLAVHPVNSTQVLLWCVSPLGLPPRPPTPMP